MFNTWILINFKQMNFPKIAVVLSAICLIVSAITLVAVFSDKSNDSYAFIRTNDVYDQFKLKQELAAQYTQIETSRKQTLDSLRVRLDVLQREIRSEVNAKDELVLGYRSLEKEANDLAQSYSNELKEIEGQFNEQIWSRINQYVRDYGEENQIELIFGANGNGGIMHGGTERDITDEVTAFINKKYSGTNE